MKIIVNADDLGISDSVNDAIFDAMRRGVVTSATIIANGPCVEDAARRTKEFPTCSFGIHLNLTEFAPMNAASCRDLKSILNQENRFNGNSVREVPMTAAMLRAVFREWCQQIEALLRLGVDLSHFDAHHHVHTIPQMLPVLLALKRRYKISKIRISRNLYQNNEHPSRILLAKKRAFNWTLRVMGFRTTRLFTDLETFLKVCGRRPPVANTVELMTHPGYSPRDVETVLLESYWPSSLPYEVALISYTNL